MRAYYAKNGDKLRAQSRERVAAKRLRNQRWMVEYLAGKRCRACGIEDPRLLTFNHLDPTKKLRNVADLVSKGWRLELVAAEVAKCEILCHNCHMLATFDQLGGSYHDKLTATIAKTET
ncbi:MAG: hypothetical protein [Caudoviricetes sp.]|nr:MAG: hypothetical protein [Caudoviricetes sp.]